MILFGLLLASFISAALKLPDFSATIAYPFQKICLQLSPSSSELHNLYTATVCGVSPENSKMMWDFRNTGLYHLVVVSGAHLSFLATLIFLAPFPLKINKAKKYVLILALVTYSLMSGLNPPVFRALLSYFYFQFQKKYQLGWSPFSVVAGSGLLCLVIFPAWWTSLSFLMSWLASLAILLPGRPIHKAVYCYIFMLLPMSQFQWNHPLTILFNLLLAPILGFLVLPISILPFVIPQLVFISDFVWRAILWFVSRSSEVVTTSAPLFPFTTWLIWILLFVFHIFLYQYNVRLRRSEWRHA